MKRNFLMLAIVGLIVFDGFAVVQAQSPRRGGGRARGVERLTDGLNLTPDQQVKVQPIIDQARPKIAEIHREAMQKMKAVMASTASQMRPLLTADQQKKLDENAHSRRMKGPRDTMDED